MTSSQPPTPPQESATSLRERINEQLRARARRPMAPLRTRRLLVAGYAAIGVAGLVLPWVLSERWTSASGAGGFLLLGILGIAVNRSIRNVAHLRDEVLDDLIVRLVDRFHRRAYQYLSAIALSVGLLVYYEPHVDRRWLATYGWLLVTLSFGAPSALAALTFPDDDAGELH